MSQEIVKRNADYLARYDTDTKDGFEHFATESGPGIVGRLLVCKKGDWQIGQDALTPPADARYLFLVDTLSRGWMKWQGGVVVDADMGLVSENFRVKHRHALGDNDESEWEKDPAGEPRDPWSKSFRALLIEVSPPHSEVTLSGSSWGMEIALKALCSAYSTDRVKYPDAFPVVALTTHTRPNKNWGPIKGPWFDVVGWATPEAIKSGKKTPKAKPKLPKPEVKPSEAAGEIADMAKELDDELPNWA